MVIMQESYVTDHVYGDNARVLCNGGGRLLSAKSDARFKNSLRLLVLISSIVCVGSVQKSVL